MYVNSPRLSGSLPLSRARHQISRIKQIKVHKMHLSAIFWQILGIFGEMFLIFHDGFDGLLLESKREKLATSRILILLGWRLGEGISVRVSFHMRGHNIVN